MYGYRRSRNAPVVTPFARRAAKNACVLASLQLSRGRNDLSSRQSLAPRAAQARALQASAAGSLGLGSRAVAGLGSPESADQKVRFECDVRRRARSRRAGYAGQLLSRGLLFRNLSRQEPRRSWNAQVFSAVLVSWRHRLALHAGN